MSNTIQEPLSSRPLESPRALAACRRCAASTFDVRRGEIHALLGQNGAGKSTLVKILNGVHPAGSYTGTIRSTAGRSALLRPPMRASTGVGYVPQEIEVLEQLSVAENVFAGHTGLGDGVLVHQRKLEAAGRRNLRRSRP